MNADLRWTSKASQAMRTWTRIECAAGVLLLIATAGHAEPAASFSTIVKQRAACITNEGGDLVPADAATARAQPKPEAGCSKKELDGTVCDELDGEAEMRCLRRELGIWDELLDRLLPITAGSQRAKPVKGTIAAFRVFRDQACAAYRAVAVNPQSAASVQTCRLNETLRFTQKFYDAIHSP